MRRFLAPMVEQPVIADLVVTFAPASHVPVVDPDDLGHLPSRNLLRQARKITACTFIARFIVACG